MDPDLVRIILVVFGVLLVAGIYLWDRYKHATPTQRAVKRKRHEPEAELDPFAPPPGQRVDPSLEDFEKSARKLPPEFGSIASSDPAPTPQAAGPPDAKPQIVDDWQIAPPDAEPQGSLNLNFGAHGDGDYLHRDPALEGEVEHKLVVLNLVARNDVFAGPAIAKACAVNDLELGEMSIFHRRDGPDGPVLFSVASMVEPGSFPVDDMAGFSTPGLSIFTQLPGVRDGIEIFERMLATANLLGSQLNGELRDDRQNKLTRQMEKHLRESIIEHRRKLNLARSRH